VWGDTAVELPSQPEGAALRNWLTGETVPVHGGRLQLAHAFTTLPAAAFVQDFGS
jgi:hypothetical protein